jgi:hypothetical protein
VREKKRRDKDGERRIKRDRVFQRVRRSAQEEGEEKEKV